MRRCAICLFINLFVCFFVKAQQGCTDIPAVKPVEPRNTYRPLPSSPFIKNDKIVPIVFYNAPIKVLSPNYYNSTLGFFCQKEIQIEKAIKFPLKFRLGSVAYTDKMEGKGTGSVLPTVKK